MSALVTAEEWVDMFLAMSREDRLRVARVCIQNAEAADECWLDHHGVRIEQAQRQRREALAICQEVHEASAEMSAPGQAAASTTARRVAAALGTALWP